MSYDDDQLRTRALYAALLDGKHWSHYHTSQAFHASVDALVELLPAWIAGLADAAAVADAERQRRYEDLLLLNRMQPRLTPEQARSFGLTVIVDPEMPKDEIRMVAAREDAAEARFDG